LSPRGASDKIGFLLLILRYLAINRKRERANGYTALSGLKLNVCGQSTAQNYLVKIEICHNFFSFYFTFSSLFEIFLHMQCFANHSLEQPSLCK
jgi:hypothetical protein